MKKLSAILFIIGLLAVHECSYQEATERKYERITESRTSATGGKHRD